MPNFDPTQNYSGVSGYGSDPYSNYGAGYNVPYGATNPTLQAYQQQLNAWYQNAYSFYVNLQNGDPSKAIVAQELQTAQMYAQESGFMMRGNLSAVGGLAGNWDSLP